MQESLMMQANPASQEEQKYSNEHNNGGYKAPIEENKS